MTVPPKDDTTRVLVPRYMFRHCLDKLAKQGFAPAPATAEYKGLKFRAYAISLAIQDEESYNRSLQALAPLVNKNLPPQPQFQPIEVNCDGRVMPCIFKDRPDLACSNADAERDFPGDAQCIARARMAKPAYEALLARFCGLTGLKAKLMVAKYANYDPLPTVKGEINLIVNAAPTGRAVAVNRLSLFGERICDDNEMASCHQPTKGRGLVLQDPDGKEAVQVIGNTAYLFCPLFGPYYGPASERIFWNLLALAWQGMNPAAEARDSEESEAETDSGSASASEPDSADEPKPFISKREFVEAGLKGERNWADYIDDHISQTRADIDRFLEAMAVRRRKLLELQSIKDGVQKTSRTAKGRLNKDYGRLLDMPEIESIAVVDEGLHFRTGPIAVEHEGRRYATSRSFVIRLDFNGAKLLVWGEEPFHPHGHSHPHLERDQAPCYGNAGVALYEAQAEWRVFDAVNLALRWLKHGYTPELARYPVESWPLAGEDGLPLPLEQQPAEYVKQVITALATRREALPPDIDWQKLLESEAGREAMQSLSQRLSKELALILPDFDGDSPEKVEALAELIGAGALKVAGVALEEGDEDEAENSADAEAAALALEKASHE